MRDKNDFLEWAEVHGNFYGTSKKFVEDCLADGLHLLFDLDVQGTDSMKAYFGTNIIGTIIKQFTGDFAIDRILT